eukprot:TRINITY_DN846_c0_g2_i1.p1 TRINITY_DN846_c0_g2~~TRINITY_DN846_c0_g2_i1.p1  ORF type:complete len:448 (+),score=83.73 TRINITY_DN846_c0_g2_i1:52-1395(+)
MKRVEVLRSHIHSRPEIHFFFDVSSINSYRAHHQIEEVASQTGAEVVYQPFLLGGLFKNIMPHISYTVDTKIGKFTQYGPVPWMMRVKTPPESKLNKFQGFPAIVQMLNEREGLTNVKRPLAAGAPAIHAMRICTAAKMKGNSYARDACFAVHKMYHDDNKNVTQQMASDYLFNIDTEITPDTKQQLATDTDDALRNKNVFGTPTFIANIGSVSEQFFGVDRLPILYKFLKPDLSRHEIEKLLKLRVAPDNFSISKDQTVTVYHDIRSVWSYFIVSEIIRLKEKHGIKVVLKPVDVAKLQSRHGVNPGCTESEFKNKINYMEGEVQKWADFFGVPRPHKEKVEKSPFDRKPVEDVAGVSEYLAANPEATLSVYNEFWSSPSSSLPYEDAGTAVDAFTEEAIQLGASSVPVVSHEESQYAVQIDHFNPTALYILEDYLCGWRRTDAKQ